MSPQDFYDLMREMHDTFTDGDEETVHVAMDELMCDVLEYLGYGEGVEIFKNTPKWYA